LILISSFSGYGGRASFIAFALLIPKFPRVNPVIYVKKR